MIKSPEDLKKTVKCPNPSGWYLDHTMRKFSHYITWLVLHTSLTANHISFLFIAIYLGAGGLFVIGTPAAVFTAAFLLQVGYLFDCVDGEVARGRQEACISGSYLDKIAHVIVHPAIFFCIGLGLFLKNQQLLPLVAGIIAAHSYTLDQCVKKFKANTVMSVLIRHHENLTKRYDSFKHLTQDNGKVIDNADGARKKQETDTKQKSLFLFFYDLLTDFNRSTAQMNVIMIAVLADFLFQLKVVPFSLSVDVLLLVLLFYAFSNSIVFLINLYATIKGNALDKEYLVIVRKISKIKFD